MTTEAPNKKVNKKKSGGSQTTAALIVIILLLLGASIWLTIQYNNLTEEKKVNNQAIEYLNERKDSLEGELKGIQREYDSLLTNNDSINLLLAEQKEYISGLLSSKASADQKVRMYEKELGTLRKVMRSYVVQIDSLNTRNQILRTENQEIKDRLTETTTLKEELEAERQRLSDKVDNAAVLSAKNIQPIPLNSKSKPKVKAKDIAKVRTCFTVRENALIEAGKKSVYLRVYRPDSIVMIPNLNFIFEFKGEKLNYSAKRDMEYENQDVDMCIYYDKSEEFVPGKYGIELYADDHIIGVSNFTLK